MPPDEFNQLSEPLRLTRRGAAPHYTSEATIVVEQTVGALTAEYIPYVIEIGQETRLGPNLKLQIQNTIREDKTICILTQRETIDTLVEEVCILKAQVARLEEQLAELCSGRYLILK